MDDSARLSRTFLLMGLLLVMSWLLFLPMARQQKRTAPPAPPAELAEAPPIQKALTHPASPEAELHTLPKKLRKAKGGEWAWLKLRQAVLQEASGDAKGAVRSYEALVKRYEKEATRLKQPVKTGDPNNPVRQRAPYMDFAATAIFRRGELMTQKAVRDVLGIRDEDINGAFQWGERLFTASDDAWIWLREDETPRWLDLKDSRADGTPVLHHQKEDGFLRIHANGLLLQRLDLLYSKNIGYQIFDRLVALTGRNPKFSHGLAVILAAVFVYLLTFPLSRKSQKTMYEVQKLQPEMQQIQEKFKKQIAKAKNAEQKRRLSQQMNKEVWALWRKHKVNPTMGCLPILLQMPFLLFVYYSVMQYKYQFSKASFLWINNLAMPDYPLFGIYILAMFAQQKFLTTATPTADPQQAQQQKMMSWMIVVLIAIFFHNFPAAFILYWLMSSLMMTIVQLSIKRSMKAAPDGSEPKIKAIAQRPKSESAADGNPKTASVEGLRHEPVEGQAAGKGEMKAANQPANPNPHTPTDGGQRKAATKEADSPTSSNKATPPRGNRRRTD